MSRSTASRCENNASCSRWELASLTASTFQGLKGKMLGGDKFYLTSSSNVSLSPIHHSDSSLSYKQMTKDSEVQCVPGGT